MQVHVGKLPATLVRARGSQQAPPALLLHGVGLGRWIFERLQETLAVHGVSSVAVDLPGHGADVGRDVGLEELVQGVTEAVDDLGDCSVVGHSLGGYVAQVVMARRALFAAALVNPLPTPPIPLRPTRVGMRHAGPLVMGVLRGRPVSQSLEAYLDCGLDLCPEKDRSALYSLITPWPPQLLRELIRRPHVVDPAAVRCPVVVCTGKQDVLVPWRTARLVGDRFDGVVWRYDDLGHMATLQPEGVRMERDLAGFLVVPGARKVTEADAFSPQEGVGQRIRHLRRGNEGARRSAYGQRAGRQGSRAMDRWDQNLSPDAEAFSSRAPDSVER